MEVNQIDELVDDGETVVVLDSGDGVLVRLILEFICGLLNGKINSNKYDEKPKNLRHKIGSIRNYTMNTITSARCLEGDLPRYVATTIDQIEKAY